jgi:hypothetical protein
MRLLRKRLWPGSQPLTSPGGLATVSTRCQERWPLRAGASPRITLPGKPARKADPRYASEAERVPVFLGIRLGVGPGIGHQREERPVHHTGFGDRVTVERRRQQMRTSPP